MSIASNRPTTGIAEGCGHGVSGLAVLRKSLMNSRRSMGFPRAEGDVGQVNNITFLDQGATARSRWSCPLWVKSRHSAHLAGLSALPPKADMDQQGSGHSALRQRLVLFDHYGARGTERAMA